MGAAEAPDTSPQEFSLLAPSEIREDVLALLAARWLAEGYDSEELHELAGLTRQQARESGRGLLRRRTSGHPPVAACSTPCRTCGPSGRRSETGSRMTSGSTCCRCSKPTSRRSLAGGDAARW